MKVVAQIDHLYGEIGEASHQDGTQYIAMDLLRLIGHPHRLDDEEIHLFYQVERKLWKKDKYDKTRVTEVLHELPLVYVMALLGRAHFRHSNVFSTKDNI